MGILGGEVMVTQELIWSKVVGILGDVADIGEVKLESGKVRSTVGICIGKEEVMGWLKGGFIRIMESVCGGCLRLDVLGSRVCVMCG